MSLSSERMHIMFFRPIPLQGGIQWFGLTKIKRVVDMEVKTQFVILPRFVAQGGEGPDEKHLWLCREAGTIYEKDDGTFVQIGLIPVKRLVPRRLILNFSKEENPSTSEEQWQCSKKLRNGTKIIYVLDKNFSEEKMDPRVPWVCEVTEWVFCSDDQGFMIFTVMPLQE